MAIFSFKDRSYMQEVGFRYSYVYFSTLRNYKFEHIAVAFIFIYIFRLKNVCGGFGSRVVI